MSVLVNEAEFLKLLKRDRELRGHESSYSGHRGNNATRRRDAFKWIRRKIHQHEGKKFSQASQGSGAKEFNG